MWFIPVIAIVIAAIILITAIRCLLGARLLKDVTQDSLIIFGKKGKGKTLLCSEIDRRAKNGCLSNTDFKHKKSGQIAIKDISIEPNTWEDILNGKIIKIEKKEFEGKPIIIDDAGLYLPNYADSMLKKLYPSMPPAFAVWRHLYNAPIHINSQDVERVWKLLREQQSGCIQCRKTVHIGPFGFVHCTYYDKIAAAAQGLLPMKETILNKFNAAEVNTYKATNGLIKDFLIFAPTWRNKYDSRYFHKVFFGVDAPKREKRRKCKVNKQVDNFVK